MGTRLFLLPCIFMLRENAWGSAQQWPVRLHSNSSVSLEGSEYNEIAFESEVTTIYNKLTLSNDVDFEFSTEFEIARKALDELEDEVVEAETTFGLWPSGTGNILSSSSHTCAVLDDDSVKCWGYGYSGQLGLGDTNTRGDNWYEMGDNLPAVNLGTGRKVKAISVGRSHTCAILDDDSVKCWGYNYNGELGLGDTNNRGVNSTDMGDNLLAVNLGTGRKVKAISAGGSHTCAILDDDSVKCWGYNYNGQLGLGDTNTRGDNWNEMGDNLPAVNLGTGRKAKAISAGDSQTCAVLDDNTVKCWGSNNNGRLGLGDTNNRGDNWNEMGDNLPVVNLGTGRKAKAISTGYYHTCAVLDDNTVKCWGYGYSGQLGLGDTNTRGDNWYEMGDNLPAVNLGTGRMARAISVGDSHTCAVLDDDSVKCWGSNYSGQLGVGDTNTRGDNWNEMGDNLPAVNLGTGRKAKAISAGGSHTCAALDDGSVKCWGYNNGQLGIGYLNNRGDDPYEMGDKLPLVALGTGRTVNFPSIVFAIGD